eukprot:gnl/MRDRNA2_/MRDRNA2_29121_c0_seq1.p1 gnl/MRDRNA2_/MRDRNA2_29121_c0~~gnl/MRDRNA2_/MRDRNA2_29121_c0_seq1.p1  ORF type:complete len:605 (-),score=85.70 gnl/MRDRNA2_/MRDRNA2_29121_c0_seq1:22-1836(-)
MLVLDFIPDLIATVVVTALLVCIAYAVTYLMEPQKSKALPESPTKVKADDVHVDLLKEYGRVWCIHQFVPFLDQIFLGGYGQAMDNRMLVPWSKGPADWGIRLPLLVASFIFPNHWLLMIAHVANIVSWATWTPAVWDHMTWAACLECTFVLAVLGGGGREKIADRFLPAARKELVCLYWSAAFWKLTTSWYTVYSSCAPVLLSELLAGIFTQNTMPAGGMVANGLLQFAPIFVASLEFAVALALTLRPVAGVILALGFHQTINMMPMTYAGGFSVSMCCRFTLFLPGIVTKALGPSAERALYIPAVIVGPLSAIMFAVHGGIDTACVAYLTLGFLYCRGIMHGHTFKFGGGVGWLNTAALGIGFSYAFLGPILGIQAMSSSTMYGNVKQWGGTNHMVVPTGLLQEYFTTHTHPSWAADAFGGGLLRVDSTNSSVMKQLAPAEATRNLPPFSRQLLKGVGTPARYFELYAARNYFNREDDFGASALHNRGQNDLGLQDPPYVQPAYEMRRVLALARARGESFILKYTKMPWSGTPKSYMAYEGEQVILIENSATGERTCKVGGKTCTASEIALLPPPPTWLQSLLHPYPMPLLPGDDTEVHCST